MGGMKSKEQEMRAKKKSRIKTIERLNEGDSWVYGLMPII